MVIENADNRVMSNVSVTASAISLLVATILPLLVGVVTRQTLNSGVKAIVLAVLSAITSGLTQYLTALNSHVRFDWQTAVIAAFGVFLVAAGTHYQVWKPVGASAAVAKIGVT